MNFFSHKPPVIDWDRDYAAGRYDGFDDELQWTRHAMIGGIIRTHRASSLLDVGCGFGRLREFMPAGCAYTGLDVSKVPIERSTLHAGDRFIQANVEAWKPDGMYAAIVLSEVLYYLADVLPTLHKLEGCLTPGGVLVASLYQHAHTWSRNQAVTRETRGFLHRSYHVDVDLQITSSEPPKRTWIILAGTATDRVWGGVA